ncbi:hypothetical protein M3Y99_00312200 [Aphelenchoides fujianensis]|nr:hypothetical protein M3Y99_00312200 [Aphelenchoides fujianensis]
MVEDGLKPAEHDDEIKNKNVKLTWELAFEKDSTSAVIYHSTKKQLLFVKQFRPSVWIRSLWRLPENAGKQLSELKVGHEKLDVGYAIELCAGILDKGLRVPLQLTVRIIQPGLSPKEVMREEIMEECGYKIDLDQLEDVNASAAVQHVFYATITEENRIEGGGGGNAEEGEIIEKVFMDIHNLEETALNLANAPAIFHWAVLWFIANKRKLYI